MRTRAVVMSGVDQVGVEAVDVPSPQAGEVLVKVKSSVISPGTELRCLKGTQRGLPSGPFIPGYAASGLVVESGEGAEGWLGKSVFLRSTGRASVALCWGGHVGYAVTGADTLLEVPESVDIVSAPLARLFAITHRGVVLSRPRLGMAVGVVGLGVIGQCSARLFQASGCNVIGVDPIAERVESLRKAGVAGVVAQGLASEALLAAVPEGVDILVDATGSERVLNDSVKAARRKAWGDALSPSAQIVIQGSYADRFEMDYAEFFTPEATVHFPRDCTMTDVKTVLDGMSRGRFAYADLLTWTGSAEEAASVYKKLADRDPGMVTGAFIWN